MRAFWRQVTSAPEEPRVKLRVKVHELDGVDGVDGTDGVEPVSDAWTFAIVVESAPKD